MLTWDLDTDQITPGQWLKGRVAVEQADLSPDGRYLVYAASNYDSSRGYGKGEDAVWIAVSRPPYWTALVYAPTTHSGVGGGYFLSSRLLILTREAGIGRIVWHAARFRRPFLIVSGTVPPRAGHRLGWRVEEAPAGGRIQVREEGNRRVELRTAKSGALRSFEGSGDGAHLIKWGRVTWADIDHRGRFVYPMGGKLFALDQAPVELADLTANTFERVPPPDWARQW